MSMFGGFGLESAAAALKSQTIEFTSSAPKPALVGGTYTPTATATSGLAVVLTLDSSSGSACSMPGGKVHFDAPGTCVIDANQPGDAEWEAAPQTQQKIEVVKPQTIEFTSSAPKPALVGGTYTPTATATSGLAVVLTLDSSSGPACSMPEGKVEFKAAGMCVIDANQPGGGEWGAAPETQQKIEVVKKPQKLEFTSAAPSSAVVGGPAYTVTADASPSKLAVIFTIDASSSSVCTVLGSTVSFVGAGTCTIDANQEGNGQYKAAAQAQQSFTVAAAPTVVTVVPGPKPSPPPPGPTPGGTGTSAFAAGATSFVSKTGMVIFTETITNPGTFKWLVTVPNGKFGVLVSSRKCKAGLVLLRGRCRPSKIVFSTGSAPVPAGVVIFKLRPSASALKVLRNAAKQNKTVRVTATFTFQSSRGGAPVSRTQSIVVRLKRK